MIFGKRWAEVKRLLTMNKALSESFHNVRRDTSLLYKWMNYIYHQNQHQQQVLEQIQNQFSQIRRTPTLSRYEIQAIVEEHYRKQAPLQTEDASKKIMEKVLHIENRLAEIQEKTQLAQTQLQTHEKSNVEVPNGQVSMIMEKISQLGDKISNLADRKPQEAQIQRNYTSNLQQRIAKKIQRNSKAHVKNFIFNLIQKYERATGLQLREIVVEEQGLASKSSFYRLLQELENDGKIGVLQEGKEKIYFLKSQVIEK